MLPGRSTSELVRHFYDTFKHSTSYRAFRSLEEQGLLVRAALPALSRVVRPRAATASSGGGEHIKTRAPPLRAILRPRHCGGQGECRGRASVRSRERCTQSCSSAMGADPRARSRTPPAGVAPGCSSQGSSLIDRARRRLILTEMMVTDGLSEAQKAAAKKLSLSLASLPEPPTAVAPPPNARSRSAGDLVSIDKGGSAPSTPAAVTRTNSDTAVGCITVGRSGRAEVSALVNQRVQVEAFPEGWTVEGRQETMRVIKIYYAPDGRRFRSFRAALMAAEKDSGTTIATSALPPAGQRTPGSGPAESAGLTSPTSQALFGQTPPPPLPQRMPSAPQRQPSVRVCDWWRSDPYLVLRCEPQLSPTRASCRGVVFARDTRFWQAHALSGGKLRLLGRFRSRAAAARAYDRAAMRRDGARAVTNFDDYDRVAMFGEQAVTAAATPAVKLLEAERVAEELKKAEAEAAAAATAAAAAGAGAGNGSAGADGAGQANGDSRGALGEAPSPVDAGVARALQGEPTARGLRRRKEIDYNVDRAWKKAEQIAQGHSGGGNGIGNGTDGPARPRTPGEEAQAIERVIAEEEVALASLVEMLGPLPTEEQLAAAVPSAEAAAYAQAASDEAVTRQGEDIDGVKVKEEVVDDVSPPAADGNGVRVEDDAPNYRAPTGQAACTDAAVVECKEMLALVEDSASPATAPRPSAFSGGPAGAVVGEACRVCHRVDFYSRIILCDRCDAEFHLHCVKSPLLAPPAGDWYCDQCVSEGCSPPPELWVPAMCRLAGACSARVFCAAATRLVTQAVGSDAQIEAGPLSPTGKGVAPGEKGGSARKIKSSSNTASKAAAAAAAAAASAGWETTFWKVVWPALASRGWKLEPESDAAGAKQLFVPPGVVRGAPGVKKRVHYFDLPIGVLAYLSRRPVVLGEGKAANEAKAAVTAALAAARAQGSSGGHGCAPVRAAAAPSDGAGAAADAEGDDGNIQNEDCNDVGSDWEQPSRDEAIFLASVKAADAAGCRRGTSRYSAYQILHMARDESLPARRIVARARAFGLPLNSSAAYSPATLMASALRHRLFVKDPDESGGCVRYALACNMKTSANVATWRHGQWHLKHGGDAKVESDDDIPLGRELDVREVAQPWGGVSQRTIRRKLEDGQDEAPHVKRARTGPATHLADHMCWRDSTAKQVVLSKATAEEADAGAAAEPKSDNAKTSTLQRQRQRQMQVQKAAAPAAAEAPAPATVKKPSVLMEAPLDLGIGPPVVNKSPISRRPSVPASGPSGDAGWTDRAPPWAAATQALPAPEAQIQGYPKDSVPVRAFLPAPYPVGRPSVSPTLPPKLRAKFLAASPEPLPMNGSGGAAVDTATEAPGPKAPSGAGHAHASGHGNGAANVSGSDGDQTRNDAMAASREFWKKRRFLAT